jgi:YfiH family protein
VPGAPGEGDALITARGGVRVAVKTADCIPLLLFDPRQRAVAAVHAGWRGVVANIAGAAVAALGAKYGTRGDDVVAALGPAIGGCCFEVGPEVAEQFRATFPERDDLTGRTKVDLQEAVVRQLVAAGVQKLQIDRGAPCTSCGGREFFSWRRDRVLGERMFAVIGLEG